MGSGGYFQVHKFPAGAPSNTEKQELLASLSARAININTNPNHLIYL